MRVKCSQLGSFALLLMSLGIMQACASADDPDSSEQPEGDSKQAGAALTLVDGCTSAARNACSAGGCGCLNQSCSGGSCPALVDGCIQSERDGCAAVGCGCQNGVCAGGFCPLQNDGCTASERSNAAQVGCGCLDGRGFGGFCPRIGAEERYTRSGRLAVSVRYVCPIPGGVQEQSAACAGNAGQRVFFPSIGGSYPVLLWGTGAWGMLGNYDTNLLPHVASWGFVVVAPNQPTGIFEEPAHAERLLTAFGAVLTVASSPGNTLSGKIDQNRSGVFGHSAGASAGLIAMQRANASGSSFPHIKTAVGLMRPPDPPITSDPTVPNRIQMPAPRAGDGVFFVGAANDGFLPGTSSSYGSAPLAAYTRAMATRLNADHVVPQDSNLTWPNQGHPEMIWGYTLAWLRWQLHQENFGRQAFVGLPPQIQSSPNWVNAAISNP
jgi:hypothetical protein